MTTTLLVILILQGHVQPGAYVSLQPSPEECRRRAEQVIAGSTPVVRFVAKCMEHK